MDKPLPRSAPPRTAAQTGAVPVGAAPVKAAVPAGGKAGTNSPPANSKRWSLGHEIAYIAFGCLGSLLGVFFFIASIGFLVGSHYLQGVIKDIGSTNFTEQMERFDHYTSFFEALQTAGYKVVREDPEIDQGVIYYLWQVTPPGSEESRVFRWRHDLASNAVQPLNNPALLLDLKLGYVKAQEAAAWKFDDPGQQFDPGDTLAQAMVNNDFSLINPADLADQAQAATLPEDPVGAPLISPQDGAHRGGSTSAEEDPGAKGEETTPGTGDGSAAQPVDPGTAPPAGGGEQPPADPGAGGGADPGGGNGGSGGSDPGGETIDVH